MTYLIPLIIILSLLNAAILSKLEKGQANLEELVNNDLVLKVPDAYKFLAYFIMLSGFSVILIGIFKFGFDLNNLIITSSIFLFTLFIGSYTLLYQKNHKVTFTCQDITIFNTFKKPKTLNWSEIKSISLNSFLSMYRIKTSNRSFYINQHLIGLSALFAFADQKGIKTLPNRVSGHNIKF